MADTLFPLPKFFFKVSLDGSGPGELAFQEVSGLDREAQHLEYRHGDSKEFVTEKRLGIIKTSTISLKRGVFTGKSELADLFKDIWDDKRFYSQDTAPIDLTIQLLDEKESTVVTWKIKGAVPVKITGTDLKSEANEISVEQMDFVHSGISIEY